MSEYEDGWRHRGSCNNFNPDWWTPSDVNSTEAQQAVSICYSCPVKQRCGEWARANVKLCAGAIYGGVFYTGGGNRKVRESLVQPSARSPRKANNVAYGQMPIALIQQMASLGCTDKQIAAMVGTTEGSIATTRHKHGIPGGKLARV